MEGEEGQGRAEAGGWGRKEERGQEAGRAEKG